MGTNNTVFLGLAVMGGLALGAAPTGDRTRPIVAFPAEGQGVLETAGSAVISIQLSNPAGRDVLVPFSVGGSATDGVDYAIGPSPVLVRAGMTSAVIPLTIFDDDDHEGTESVEVTLGAPSTGQLGGVTVHTVAIQDGKLGDPIDGLDPAERLAFRRGRAVFEKRFAPSEGLGPFYNATSCASCHSTPITGGASALYRNFYMSVYYEFTPGNQSSSIPPFLSQIVPAYGSGDLHVNANFTLEGGRPLMPDTVFGLPTIQAQRNAIPVFGTGLFEFISDATIMAGADPNDSSPSDGISGRINTQLNGQAVGRFGSKAQVNNVELFTRGPLQNQMGITTDPLLGGSGIVSFSAMQVSADPNDPTTDDDGVPDPEMSSDDLGDLVAFTRFLGPPPQRAFTAQARQGQQLFEQIGCTLCHMPELPSTRGPVRAYTDLLIHDMGSDLVDNLRLGDSPFALTDFRTQPLWGVSQVGPYLHDGRAATLDEAVSLHGGEGSTSRDAFVALPADDRAAVIAFLEHL